LYKWWAYRSWFLRGKNSLKNEVSDPEFEDEHDDNQSESTDSNFKEGQDNSVNKSGTEYDKEEDLNVIKVEKGYKGKLIVRQVNPRKVFIICNKLLYWSFI
jgi:hypothetical protein